jgi:Tetracyclin repressor-like, C-terminal domain
MSRVTIGIAMLMSRSSYGAGENAAHVRVGAFRKASRNRVRSSYRLPGLMYDLADRVGAVFTEQFRRAGYDRKAAPIYAHALVGMVAFVGQWWTESRKSLAPEAVASHLAALAWMGLRHLPRRPSLLATTRGHGRRVDGA